MIGTPPPRKLVAMAPETTPRTSTQREVGLRPPELVMRLERMGSFFSTRLSFMPTLIRRLSREGWRFSRPAFALDAQGYGHAIYCFSNGTQAYSLVAFSHQLDPSARTDRVIAEAWDATFALFDGIPNPTDIERLSQNVPLQEAGRYLPSELVLSRANKSIRLFDHIATSLADGRQPDPAMLVSVGYLMRTTAVYGNGKFGIADRAKYADRPELSGPFQAEMLTVYLIRCFTIDLVEHVARRRNPDAFVPLETKLKRHIGVGNATGLGMAPFLITHPVLINNWIAARETALARVRSLAHVETAPFAHFCDLIARARRHLAEWSTEDSRQSSRIAKLRENLADLQSWTCAGADWLDAPLPWDALFRRAETCLSLEAQELLVSLLLEPHGKLVDGLADSMAAEARERLDPAMPLAQLHNLLRAPYGWALAINFHDPEQMRHFWYVSEEKLEPRLGDRYREQGAEREMPLAIARDVQALALALAGEDEQITTAAFLMRRPEFRQLVRRVQTIASHPYGEIRDNLVASSCLPIDLLRCKLSFFGATKFDPKSDRWTRITMYQGAPFPDELGTPIAEDWSFPALDASA